MGGLGLGGLFGRWRRCIRGCGGGQGGCLFRLLARGLWRRCHFYFYFTLVAVVALLFLSVVLWVWVWVRGVRDVKWRKMEWKEGVSKHLRGFAVGSLTKAATSHPKDTRTRLHPPPPPPPGRRRGATQWQALTAKGRPQARGISSLDDWHTFIFHSLKAVLPHLRENVCAVEGAAAKANGKERKAK